MPRSLHSRLLIVAGVVLATFLGAAGWVLDHGFRQTAISSVQERLKGQIFMLLGLADLDHPKQPLDTAEIPDLALTTPESGHYAQIYNADGDNALSLELSEFSITSRISKAPRFSIRRSVAASPCSVHR